MKVYISGKMSGLSKRQILKKFRKTEKKLLKENYSVMNPSVTYHLLDTSGFSYNDYLLIDFKMIDVCDCIYMQKDWINSNGAKLELEYAQTHGKQVIYE